MVLARVAALPWGMSRSAIVLLLLCACCKPAIYSFEAKPNMSCPGARFMLSWNASKTGTVSAKPNAFEFEVPERKGEKSLTTPDVTTRYRFHIANIWGEDNREVDVRVPESKPVPVGQSIADDSARCVDGKLSVMAKAPPPLWQSNLVVAQLTTLPGDPHTYHLEHAGKTADLAPGATSNAFAGTLVAGDWLLSIKLEGEEHCMADDAPAKVPLNLGVNVITACTP